jgi:hypothetical protein
MILPRSLSIHETRPTPPVWRCEVHGDLPPGETVCAECEDEAS